MTAAEIRERFLSFFEERGHLRVPSASLVPASYDPTVLLTTAGMQPFKPYFLGEEEPPSKRLTSCQKVFRTTDIENVGLTARHLTFFEMLGNFSVGDYFKQGAVEFAWELSIEGFGFEPERVWITVFGGDDELGLGPDEEAIACWRSIGVPDERIVRLGREDNFWQSGPTGPCGPCSELYLDRGPDFGPDSDRPGDDTERYPRVLEPRVHAVRAARRTRRSPSCRRRTSTRAWASTGWRRSCRTFRRSTRPTPSGRWSSSASSARAVATGRTTPAPERCACWPTTAARLPS